MDFKDFMNTPPSGAHEPAADWLGLAQGNFEIYTAHIKAGFDPWQALYLTSVSLSTLLGHALRNGFGDDK